MEHSEKFELVKSYYDAGIWSKKAVKNAVKKGWINIWKSSGKSFQAELEKWMIWWRKSHW